MKKGFEYWKSPNIKTHFIAYWILYAMLLSFLLWHTYRNQSAALFTILALIPYFALIVLRILRRPFQPGTTNKIKEIDNTLYKEIFNKNSRLKPDHKYNKKHEEMFFIFTLMKSKWEIRHPEIRSYANNTNLLVKSSAITLGIWFFGTILNIYLLAIIK